MIKKILRFLFGPKKKEYYTKVRPEDYERLVKKGVQLELAELRRENLELRKELEEKEKIIERLREQLEKKREKELEKAKKMLLEAEELNTYDIYFKNPIPVVSGGPGNVFFMQNGIVYIYLVGIRLKKTPNGLLIYPILSSKKGKKAILKPNPPITYKEFFDMFYDAENLVYYLSRGVVKLNILPDGTRIIPKFPLKVVEIEK